MITVHRIPHTLPPAYEWKVDGRMVTVMHKPALEALVCALQKLETVELPGGVWPSGSPTGFTTIRGMLQAIQYELERNDHPPPIDLSKPHI